MRLRLIIQRHSLPPVQLLWTVGDDPSPFSPGPSATTSQLLEQVNEIIPLESEDWGLEDYAVEVCGFECLHFSELSHILREDDEVCIRPLQTSDLRFRRVSGRHQISASGKHLIDGVAFGRPFLGRADRPPIRIPSRKRRRITYDDEANDIFDEHASNQQVAVQGGLGPNYSIVDRDSETDDEYSPGEDDMDDLSMELKDIRNDGDNTAGVDDFVVVENMETPSNPGGLVEWPRRSARSRKAGGLCLEGEDMLKLVDENGRPYPGEYNNPLLDLYLDGNDEPQFQPEKHKIKHRKKRRLSNRQATVDIATEELSTRPEGVRRGSSSASRKGVRFQDVDLETPATIRESQDSDQSDEDFQPSSDITPNLHESDKENSQPQYEAADSSVAQTQKSSASSSASFQGESEAKYSSFHSSVTSTSSDSDVAHLAPHSCSDAEAGASETSSSGSSSDSDHSILVNIIQPEKELNQGEQVSCFLKGVRRPSPGRNEESKNRAKTLKTQAPYAGRSTTQRRNQRRRDSKRLKALQSKGVLLPNATLEHFRRMQNHGVAALDLSDERERKSQEEAVAAHATFEAKRESMLKAIASGGIDITHKEQENRSAKSHINEDTTIVDEAGPDFEERPSNDAGAGISDRLQRQDQSPRGKFAHNLLNESMVSANNTTGHVDETRGFFNEIEALPAGVKAVGDWFTTPVEIEAPPDEIITPNEAESPPDEISALPNETSALADETAVIADETTAEINKATSLSKSPKRSRLDISSSKRLVFGSLGMRVPKTKKDEAILSAQLMKDVRPLQVSRPEETNDVSEPAITRPIENDDSWKDKIVLMAVECCEEGVELSTPPFPFVQRWDPQQKKNYKGGNNSRRDKKRKRNNSQLYSQKSNHETNDMYVWGTSNSFGVEAPAANENLEPLLEQQEQSASRIENDEQENEMNGQIQSEADDSALASADIEGIEDLPGLPEDMTTCLSLTEAIATPGAIVAFKQLDMSEETNWQPKISDYRTASIDCLTDDGTLRMILAKRDRPNKGDLYDQHTGERIYSKFEMPGYDEEDAGNSGVVEISFSELIEPKLIQAADFQSANQQYSVPGSNQLTPNVDTAMETKPQTSPADSNPTDPELAEAIFSESRMNGATEGVRQEIFDLIKEAGWHSSVLSNNDDDQRFEQSPQFSRNRSMSQDEAYDEGERANQVLSKQLHNFNSSPSGLNTDQRSPEGLLADSPSSLQSPQNFEKAETLLVERNTVPNTPSRNVSGNDDEAVEVKEEENDEGLVWSEAQHQLAVNHRMSSQELSSQNPPRRSIPRPAQPKGQNSNLVSSPVLPTSLDAVSSDNEFPTLENVFSQVRSSQAISSQAQSSFEPRLSDNDLTYMAKSSFGSTTTRGEDSQKGVARKSKKRKISNEHNMSQNRTLFKWDDSDGGGEETTPRASQVQTQSQIVDLTLSSDPADPPGDSDYVDDGTQLPDGPGWVKKTRASSRRLGSVIPAERRSIRSRSRSVY